jgi:hypothetical protein
VPCSEVTDELRKAGDFKIPDSGVFIGLNGVMGLLRLSLKPEKQQ